MPKPEIAELLRWYELHEALARFTDPDLAEELEQTRRELDRLSNLDGVETDAFARTSLRLNAPHRISDAQRQYDEADDQLRDLKKRQLRAFHDKLIEGKLFASAQRRISDESRIFVESGAWTYLTVSQDGRATARDKSETLYALRFRDIDPVVFGDVESRLSQGDIGSLKEIERAELFSQYLYPSGKLERTLKATQANINASLEQAGLPRVADNTITNALTRLGFYAPKKQLKKT